MTDDVAIAGCEEHQELVARAMGPDATDADLERYADEVVGCPACQRLLAVGAGVHPAHLEQVAAGEHEALEARLAMDDAAVERLERALAPRPRWPVLLLGAAAAALVVWLARPGAVPVPVPVQPIASSPPPVLQTGPLRRPLRSETLPQALPDAVVDAEPTQEADWPAPPFEELRRQVTKQVAVREARLELVGEPGIDASVRLAVRTVTSEAVSVCVSGPESGVVWRGGLPAGRTVLSRDGRAVRYRFPAPGRYRFGLALGEGCAQPVHTLEVTL